MTRSYLKINPDVEVEKQVVIAAIVINSANWLGFSVDMVVTSGYEGSHNSNSLHYKGRALDFRTKSLTHRQKHDLVAEVRRRGGPDYDVILEDEGELDEHLHVEYDPKLPPPKGTAA